MTYHFEPDHLKKKGVREMTQTLEDLAVLRLAEVKRLTGLCRSTIYQMMKDGLFPRAVALGARSVGWRACDIMAWLEARATA